MSRDWVKRAANGQGQVLACGQITVDLEDATGSGEGTPASNINIVNIINIGAGASDITIDGSKSIIGDMLILMTIGASGAYTVDLLGDMAPGQIESDGAATTFLIYNGTEFIATATPSPAP